MEVSLRVYHAVLAEVLRVSVRDKLLLQVKVHQLHQHNKDLLLRVVVLLVGWFLSGMVLVMSSSRILFPRSMQTIAHSRIVNIVLLPDFHWVVPKRMESHKLILTSF